MLHALAAEMSPREIWWLYGARRAVSTLSPKKSEHSSKPWPTATVTSATARPTRGSAGCGFRRPWTPGYRALQELGVPRNADFYICGPSAFISDLTAGLAAWGIAKGQIHAELFGPVLPILRHRRLPTGRRTRPPGLPVRDRWFPLPEWPNVHWDLRFRASLSLPKRAMSPCDGRAARGSATVVKPGLWRDSRLRARPNRSAGGRQCADLLLRPQGDVVHRSLTQCRSPHSS